MDRCESKVGRLREREREGEGARECLQKSSLPSHRLKGMEWHIVFFRPANILPRLVNSETRWLGAKTRVAKVVIAPLMWLFR